MGDVHDHRHGREIAHDAHHVDHAVFAELDDGAAVGRFTHPPVAQQLAAEVEGNRFVLAHVRWPPSIGERGNRVIGYPGLAGERSMDKPLEVLSPFPRDDEHDELADRLLERAVEPEVLAYLL